MLKVIVLIILSVLAFLGGLSLTKHARMQRHLRKAQDIVRACNPCSCGCDTLYILMGEDDKEYVIECERCGRKVRHGDVVARWNRGESDVEL